MVTGGIAALAASVATSAAYGPAGFSYGAVVSAVTGSRASDVEALIATVRIPRALVAASVGAALAVAGRIMQVLTRNPLAAPGILGLNAGAALAVVAAAVVGVTSGAASIWIALAGAAAAGAIVYAMAATGPGGASPLKLTLVGAALTILMMSLTQGILVVDEQTLDQSRRWLAGSVAGRDFLQLQQVGPFVIFGILGGLAMGRALSTLNLGDDVARSLGQRPGRVRLGGAAVVVVLAGAGVALAGPVAFVGLAVPHVSRFLVGSDERWILPMAAVLGAAMLVSADLVSRLLASPNELPLGAVTAIVGAPVFIRIARSAWRTR